MRQIAFYGKGGIGKSTTTANISAAIASMGHKVMQIGCDPKADSTVTLTRGNRISSVLHTIRAAQLSNGNGGGLNTIQLKDLVFEGFSGILCCEAGGPEPGVGCAGRGIITAIELLKDYDAFAIHQPDFVFFDVLGDVVCGGFAMPIRKGLAEEVYVVTSGEMMAIYACNNIFKGIAKFARKGKTRVGGIVLNARGTHNEEALIRDFARRTNTRLMHVIPRRRIVQESEMQGMTTLEYAVESEQAAEYKALGGKIIANTHKTIPEPMDDETFTAWVKENAASL